MSMLEGNRQPQLRGTSGASGPDLKQRRQMLVALAFLLVALIAVFVRDQDFWKQYWFPSSTADVEGGDDTGATAVPPDHVAGPSDSPSHTRAKSRAATTTLPNATHSEGGLNPVVTNRAVLPPLEVEVVAGDQKRTIRPGSSSVKVDMQRGAPPSAASTPVTSASEKVSLSSSTAEVVSHPVDPSYPLLAKQMKVQGSVVLQALIGKDGNIQDLHVLSGPEILSVAAREAVKQWRFKPYYQSGQAVDTEARITVNFTISTY